eukprot:TRINITY_DN3558_c0_g2_i1.p1 TRINITY_DN3558_c0_g2~~TRINITY_DN3558_c0_g2_i1.p1  ORF type:complete len:190 (+),score=71.58 TRINITY_DN3558_c0_g2_i1:44-571(+)
MSEAMQEIKKSFSQEEVAEQFRSVMNDYSPFKGAGVEITKISPDFKFMEVKCGLYPWTKNYVGTIFGGASFTMVDPIYMLMFIQLLGDEFVVWDKSASIDFVRPGTSTVYARLDISDEMVEDIKQSTLEAPFKCERVFHVDVLDESGKVVVAVSKRLYFRRKTASKTTSRTTAKL